LINLHKRQLYDRTETETNITVNLYNSGVKYTINSHQNNTIYATSDWTPLLQTSSKNFNPLCKYFGFSDTQFIAKFSVRVSFNSSN